MDLPEKDRPQWRTIGHEEGFSLYVTTYRHLGKNVREHLFITYENDDG